MVGMTLEFHIWDAYAPVFYNNPNKIWSIGGTKGFQHHRCLDPWMRAPCSSPSSCVSFWSCFIFMWSFSFCFCFLAILCLSFLVVLFLVSLGSFCVYVCSFYGHFTWPFGCFLFFLGIILHLSVVILCPLAVLRDFEIRHINNHFIQRLWPMGPLRAL